MQTIICNRHDLRFSFDEDRARELGKEPATLRCPICADEQTRYWIDEATKRGQHRDLLLKAIDLKVLLQREEPSNG